MNEPRRREGHEGKKEEESFWCCCGYFCKIGMLPLKQLTKAVQGRAKIQIITTITGDQPLPEEVKLVFYRVTQEALNNIIKHAQSTQVDVTFQGNSEYIKLSISDNGCGFDFKDTPSDHLGIAIMKERAESIGATFQLESYLGKGTKIILTWLINGR